MKTYLIITLLFCSIFSFGQTDTIQLPQDGLGLEDIRITAEQIAQNQVFTPSRTMNNVDELPYSIYVVTGEEILRNGYFTLTDALKSVPGIFVSQPGSAIEGETFMMNGLHGNTHAKVLINGIPIKVNDINGVPIGNQLPIRQAERIEITYGPSSVIHGTEAAAGVINIITRTSERPVYTHADLGVGTQGYNTVNVLFGGKLGKNKRVLKFNAYGSSTERTTLNLNTLGGVFDPINYPLNSFVDYPEGRFRNGLLPHTSRQVGINLSIRNFTWSAARMERTDHVALGANPLSYNNQSQQTNYGERITNYSFQWKKNFERRKWGLKSSLYFVDHEVDSESSFEYIQPHLKQLLNYASDIASAGDVELRNVYIDSLDNSYFSGERFVGGRSINAKAEQTVSIFPFENLELIFGGNFEIVDGRPYVEYLEEPYNNTISGNNYVNTNLFFQSYLTFNKVNIIFGLNSYNFGLGADLEGESRNKLLPRFAGLYKINSKLNLRASYATSYMVPAEYLNKKSGIISIRDNQIPQLDIDPFTGSSFNSIYRLNSQQTTYIDLGVRYKINNKIRFDVSVFQSENDNLIYYEDEFIRLPNSNDIDILYGYNNTNGDQSRLLGLRASAIFKDLIPSREFDINAHFSYFNGEQDLPSGELFPHIVNQPDFLGQLSVSLRLYKKLYITGQYFISGIFASRSLSTLDQFYAGESPRYRRIVRSLTDVSFDLNLNNNFKIFSKLGNISPSPGQNGGIDASGSPDDALFNVQRDFYFRGGVSYTIN